LRKAWLLAGVQHRIWANRQGPDAPAQRPVDTVEASTPSGDSDVSRETSLGAIATPFPLEALETELPVELFDRLERYAQEVLQGNRRLALVSRRDPAQQIHVNILDSLPLGILLARRLSDPLSPTEGPAPARSAEATFLLDAGSGSGCPGIPATLALRALTGNLSGPPPALLLLESVGKKAEFLAQAVENLGLERAQVLRQRLEDPVLIDILEDGGFGAAGILSSRGLAKVARTLKWSRSLKPHLTECLLIKGVEGLRQEWSSEGRQWARWGWRPQSAYRFEFPQRSQILLGLRPRVSA
jgi:16S rRNA G527 N7-methylase RsmG